MACARRDREQVLPQVAVLRFENLSADPSLDWMGRGFSEIVSGELRGSPQLYSLGRRALHSFDASLGRRTGGAPGISTERTAALVAGANRIVYGDFFVVKGALHATATEEDLATHKMVLTAAASGPASGGVFPVAGALARQLGETQPFGTRNAEALRDYVAALDSADPDTASRSCAQAVSADPDFWPAYSCGLEAALGQQNRAEADRIVAEARARQARFSAADRAALDLDAAALRGDFTAQLEARRNLARLDPADPNLHRALAEALMNLRDYDAAIVEFRRALTIRPDDPAALNVMGYAAAYSGDLPTAIRVLRGYEQLRPNEPNPLDSLGDVHFALGHFGEAEQFYLAAQAKAPGFLNGGELLKAAQARLMTGDVASATALFEHFRAAREAAHDPSAPYHAAAWSWQTGARRAAIAAMDHVARADASGPFHEIASRADAQAAIWLLDLGDRAGAAGHARQAIAEAGPATSAIAVMTAFLAQPETYPLPAEFPLKDYAHAYALLFARQFQPAAQALQEIYQRPTNEFDDGLAVVLAWAYAESGDWKHAQPLLRLSPLPQGAGLPLFSSLYFPRLFFLRGAVLRQEGQAAQAARYFQIFRTLSGPDATIWGEEQRAGQ